MRTQMACVNEHARTSINNLPVVLGSRHIRVSFAREPHYSHALRIALTVIHDKGFMDLSNCFGEECLDMKSLGSLSVNVQEAEDSQNTRILRKADSAHLQYLGTLRNNEKHSRGPLQRRHLLAAR